MEANDLKTQIDVMMSGLNGMVSVLEKTVTQSFSNMSTDQAKEFAQAMKNANVHEKVEEIKKESKKLKTDLNID